MPYMHMHVVKKSGNGVSTCSAHNGVSSTYNGASTARNG
jgi:hypothetical protein